MDRGGNGWQGGLSGRKVREIICELCEMFDKAKSHYEKRRVPQSDY